VTPTCFGCSSEFLRRGECIHAGGRSRRPMLASTLHNRHVCRHTNHWKCPVVIVSIPLARRHRSGLLVMVIVGHVSVPVILWIEVRADARRRVQEPRAGAPLENRHGLKLVSIAVSPSTGVSAYADAIAQVKASFRRRNCRHVVYNCDRGERTWPAETDRLSAGAPLACLG
jgi:hypothetical protein